MTQMTLDNLVAGRQARPLRISLYGVDGVGKSTFAAGAPAPIFIGAEQGTAHLDIIRFPPPGSWEDILQALGTLYEQEHDFRTVVLDSADWAERLAAQEVAKNSQVEQMEDLGYGRWKRQFVAKWDQFLSGLEALAVRRNMHSIIVSHAQIKVFNDPEPERGSYDRYQLKVYETVAALIREWSDYNLFLNFDTSITKDKNNFNKLKAKSFGRRELHSMRTAAYDAKRRYPIPQTIVLPETLDPAPCWDAFYQEHLKASGQAQAAAPVATIPSPMPAEQSQPKPSPRRRSKPPPKAASDHQTPDDVIPF